FMVVPGMGATFAAFGPGEIGFPSRVIVTLGLGYAVTALAGYVLTILHIMHALPFFALVGLATVAAWHLAVRKGNVRGQGRALVRRPRAGPATDGPAVHRADRGEPPVPGPRDHERPDQLQDRSVRQGDRAGSPGAGDPGAPAPHGPPGRSPGRVHGGRRGGHAPRPDRGGRGHGRVVRGGA